MSFLSMTVRAPRVVLILKGVMAETKKEPIINHLFKRFVQVGRVVRLLAGRDENKLAVIVEIIDHHRVLIDGPTTGVTRRPIKISAVALTPFKIKTTRGARTVILKKDIEKKDFVPTYNNTTVAKKLAAKAHRDSLNDFEKYKARQLRRAKETIITREFKKVKKEALVAASKK